MPADVKVHLTISGRVQGVGFRYFTQDAAVRLGLKGYVRNLWNGDVEAEAEAPRNLLERFIQDLHRGPAMARVDEINVEWEEATGTFTRFEIRR